MNNLQKRIFLGSILGLIFGTLCFAGFSSNPNMPEEIIKYQEWSWSNIMMWSIIINRYAIGFFVAIMGFITIHPCFKFKMPVFLRGMVPGFLISLPMALGALMGNNIESAHTGFWIILILGTVIGSIIDIIITKIAGQGNDLKIEK